MQLRNMKLDGMMFAGLIIVISFVYAINVQPVVVGKPDVFSNYDDQLDSYQTYQNKEVFIDNTENPHIKSKILTFNVIKFNSRNLADSTSPSQLASLDHNYFRCNYQINSDVLDNLLIKIFVIIGL